MRLNKYIAQAGLASRRKADLLIESERVKINGEVMDVQGYIVKKDDVVEVDGSIIEPVKKYVYIMLNKPKGYLTTVSDDKGRPTVMDLVGDMDERVFPVGRLDYNTKGMLLLTNDGDFAFRMSHPSHQISKTYKARVAGNLSRERVARLKKGVDIGGFITSPASVNVIRQMDHQAVVEIKIKEGKNRQVRKMFAAVGNKVLDLERIATGNLMLGHLMPGHYRKLTKNELDRLFSE